MAQRTLSALGVLAQQVADETAPGANTAERVGDILQDIIDSCGKNEYVARVTQSGTGDPVAAVVKNTTGATVAWTRSGAGFGTATFSSAVLTSLKNSLQYTGRGSGGYTDPKYFGGQVASTTVVNFACYRYSDDTAEDGWVLDVVISIYP